MGNLAAQNGDAGCVPRFRRLLRRRTRVSTRKAGSTLRSSPGRTRRQIRPGHRPAAAPDVFVDWMPRGPGRRAKKGRCAGQHRRRSSALRLNAEPSGFDKRDQRQPTDFKGPARRGLVAQRVPVPSPGGTGSAYKTPPPPPPPPAPPPPPPPPPMGGAPASRCCKAGLFQRRSPLLQKQAGLISNDDLQNEYLAAFIEGRDESRAAHRFSNTEVRAWRTLEGRLYSTEKLTGRTPNFRREEFGRFVSKASPRGWIYAIKETQDEGGQGSFRQTMLSGARRRAPRPAI